MIWAALLMVTDTLIHYKNRLKIYSFIKRNSIGRHLQQIPVIRLTGIHTIHQPLDQQRCKYRKRVFGMYAYKRSEVYRE